MKKLTKKEYGRMIELKEKAKKNFEANFDGFFVTDWLSDREADEYTSLNDRYWETKE